MDVTQLRSFIAVVDAGSMSRAARGLGLTQPALSQQMSRLEASLSTRLLERTTRGVVPTRSGAEFYRGAHRLIREFDQLARATTQDHGVRGSVAVGLPSAAANQLAAPLFSWARSHHPGIRLELFESMSGQVRELFDRGRLDIALLYTHEPKGAPRGTPLYDEELRLIVAAHDPLSRCTTVTMDEIAQRPLVAPGPRSQLRSLIDSAFERCGLEPRIIADVSSLATMLRIAEEGHAVALLPRSAVGRDSDAISSTVAVLDVSDASLTRYTHIDVIQDAPVIGEATSAIRAGILECTRSLAVSGRWPGIRLSDAHR